MGNVEQRTNYCQLCSNNEKFPGKEDSLQIKQKLNLLNLHMYNAYFCDAQQKKKDFKNDQSLNSQLKNNIF